MSDNIDDPEFQSGQIPNREGPPLDTGEMVSAISYAMTSRRSIRGFLPTLVPKRTVSEILKLASRAPSGSNVQPWCVHVVTGAVLGRLTKDMTEACLSRQPAAREYDYYPKKWREPYLARRREAGWGLYGLAKIEKGDKEAGLRQHALNYSFFGAPVGLIFSIDLDLEQGSWLDYGMFLQSIMIAARARGLDTCAQAAFADYPDTIREILGIPRTQAIVCGMALGYADPQVETNLLVTNRSDVEEFTTYHDA